MTEWNGPYFIETLAAAYGEAKDFKAAVEYQKQALASSDIPDAAIEKDRRRLQLYEAGKSYRDK